LTLLQETDPEGILDRNVQTLFNVFGSMYYQKTSRVLRWGHNYYFGDILGGEDQSFRENIKAAHNAILVDPMDPTHFDFQKGEAYNTENNTISTTPAPSCSSTVSGIHSLPPEIFQSIVCNLSFHDTQQLLWASASLYRLYSGNSLPPLFWESRFWAHSEAGFALSIRPPSCVYKDWFFKIRSELRKGENKLGLRNRKRIWRLAIELIDLVNAIEERVLQGDLVTSLQGQTRSYIASCLASKHDSKGCRELMQRFVYLGNRSQLCAVTPSYIHFSNRRLVSGLSFEFGDGRSADVGYILARQAGHIHTMVSPRFLYLVASRLGFEAITVDIYPQKLLDSSNGAEVAIARWALKDVDYVCLGLDVRLFIECTNLSDI
jgi:hypothetical protein